MRKVNCKKLPSLAIVLIAFFSILWAQGLPMTIGQTAQTTQTTLTTSVKSDYHSWRKSLHHNPTPQRGCFTITYPATVWQSTHCVTGPTVPLKPMPPSAVGNGVDDVAYSSSGTPIASSTGSFQSIGGLTIETDSQEGSNYYSLQINSQFFSTNTPYTSNKAATGWEQFVFENDPSYGFGYIYIQYWLIDYGSTYGSCPNLGPPDGTSWMAYSGSCYANSVDTSTPLESASNLSNLILEGDANLNSNDENLLCVTGGSCYAISPPADVLDLYQHWLYSEFNVFGFCCGSRANFNAGTTITVTNTLEDSSGNAIAPSCVETGYTGETNNLNLSSCSANSNSGEILFSQISPAASVNPSSVVQGQSVTYAGSGFTPTGAVTVLIDSGSGFDYVVGTPTASSTGGISGSFIAGTNIEPGSRQVTFTDGTTGLSASADVTVVQLSAATTTMTVTSTTSTLTSSTSTYLATTTTSSTSVSTSTVGQVCTATSTTQTTSIIIEATTSSTTTTTTTSTTSTSVTTTSSTSTSTYLTTTTTTTTACTQTSTSTSTSVTLTTFTRPSTGITLASSPSTIPVGSSVTLSGSISPSPGAVTVTISFSRDGGSTWVMLLSVLSDSSGNYNAYWTPPAPGNYLLEASWSGNDQLAPSQSSSESLSVTGSAAPAPTVLLSTPTNATQDQTVTLFVTVFNPTGSAANESVTIQITGPNNYVSFDVIQVEVSGNSRSTGYYDWIVPSTSGTYAVIASFLPPTLGGVDLQTVQVS